MSDPDTIAGADDLTAALRLKKVREIVLDVLQRRAKGDVLPDEVVLQEYLNLMPELAVELQTAQQVQRSVLAAQKAGGDSRIEEVLPAEELEKPITLAPEASYAPIKDRRVSIPGYAVLEELGRGGQAVVYRARHLGTGRAVAVKVMSGSELVNPTYRARFDREVSVLAVLNHPNIVKIVDCGRTEQEAFFLVTDLIDGVDLETLAAECRKFDKHHPQLVLTVLAKIARAVQAAHEQGVVHRDLKPSNIRVDKRNEPHILDFGLATAVESDLAITVEGQWIGSIPWFSPEMASHGHHKADKASDIYAMGVLFYQALCGQFPYDVEASPRDVLNRICTVKPVPPSRVIGDHSRKMKVIDAIVLKCLEKTPGGRYRTAEECAEDIEAALAGERPKFVQLGPTPRRRLLEWIAAVIVVAIVGAAYWFWPASTGAYSLPKQTNQVGMTFVEIPAGSFWMGSSINGSDWRPDEESRRVRLTRNYWMATTEVTRRQYAKVMGLPAPADPDLPMTRVSYLEAVEFCRRLGALDGKSYRLPTEAEWEYASRSTNRQGWDDGSISQLAWHAQNSNRRMHEVAELKPNDWGLYDMIGNAEEWCLDLYGPYADLADVDPVRHPLPGGKEHVVVRGGDFNSTRRDARHAARRFARPTYSSPMIGFRVVIADPPPATRPEK
jgi:serine/threonine protein kinase